MTHACSPECAAMAARYAQGEPALTIGAGRMSPGTVLHRLRQHGVTIRPPGHPLGRGDPRHQARDAAILTAYDAGQSASQIGRTVDLTHERVRQIIVWERGEYIQPPHPLRGSHRCQEACRAVLTADPSIPWTTLAATTGISYNRIVRATTIHGLTSRRTAHRCTARCRLVQAALAAGVAPRWATRNGADAARLRSYHPDWPWFDGRRRRSVA